MYILQALLGLAVFVGLCVLFSTARSRISWRIVGVGITLQFVFALLIFKVEAAKLFFKFVNDAFMKLYEFVGLAMGFLAGDLVTRAPFLFHALPTVIVFAAFMALLYHWGIMHKLVYWIGLGMKKTLKVSGAESLSAAANIFMGQTEAPLLVSPYIARMTKSELMAIMTGGMATVAGSVMAAYVGMLKGSFPDIAGHLLAASIMSAPAAFVFAKILVPETEHPETAGDVEITHEPDPDGALHALVTGGGDGVRLAANIAAMLLIFLSLIYGLNFVWGGICAGISSLGGIDLSSIDSFQEIMGFLFAPFAWLMGVPSGDLLAAGTLLGEKTVLNEFIAYTDFAAHLSGQPLMDGVAAHAFSERSKIILAYALCGFSNFSSIGILVGGLGIFAPKRRGDMAKLGLRAMLAATLACFMTASIAAILA